jgi:hypothetical protein
MNEIGRKEGGACSTYVTFWSMNPAVTDLDVTVRGLDSVP